MKEYCNVELKQGDCLELMKDIPDKSIDMILCDLPYGITRNEWDKKIDFTSLWCEYKRIIKEHGAIVLFGNGIFSAELICSNKKMYRYNLVWVKSDGTDFLNANKKPLKKHEDILVFYKHLPIYNPQFHKGKPYKANQRSHKSQNYGDFKAGQNTDSYGRRYPTTILKFNNSNLNKKHPTQKPVDLLEYLIKTYSNEGDTILDNCMGSGSTGVACVRTNRNFIGFELDEHYFDVASERIRKEQNEMQLGCQSV